MRMRLAWVSVLIVVGLVALGGAQSAAAQGGGGGAQVKLGEGVTLTISGFINATWFVNSGFFDPGGFGQGQSAEWADSIQPATDRTFQGAEIRNTRVNFTFAGPVVMGKWTPRAVLEADFFGMIGAPPFGDEQPNLRARFAYVDLTNGGTTLRIGQFWSPMFGEVPVSITHVAFPLGYGAAGMVGWRYPGVFLYHDLNPGKPTTMQLVLSAFEGSGAAVPAAAGLPATGQGEASGLPQLEGRLNFTHRKTNFSWTGYIVGHVDWKDTSAVGVQTGNVTGSAVEVGANVTAGKFTIHGNAYTGKNIGQQFGHITQQVKAAGTVQGWGGWVQGGFEFTPHWGAWAFYGMDDPNEAKSPGLTGNFRSKNQDLAGMLRFRAGRYQLGVEYFRATTTWATSGKQHASQAALSVMYTL